MANVACFEFFYVQDAGVPLETPLAWKGFL